MGYGVWFGAMCMAQRTKVLVGSYSLEGANSCAACHQHTNQEGTQQGCSRGELTNRVHGIYQGLLPALGST